MGQPVLGEADPAEQRPAQHATQRLLELTTELTAALTVEQVAQVIVEHGTRALEASMGMVALLSDDGTRLDVAAAIGYPPDVLEGLRRIPLDGSWPVADAVRRREPVFVDSFEAAQASYPNLVDIWGASGNQSNASIPLVVDDRVVGALGLSFASPHALTEPARTFALVLARQCAQAVHRALLHQADQRARAQQRLLADISAALAGSLDEHATVQNVAALMVPTLADWCVVDLLQPDGTLQRAAAAHRDPSLAEHLRTLRTDRPLSLDDRLPIARVVRTGQPALHSTITEAELERVMAAPALSFIRDLAPRSCLFVPLVARGRTLGALSLAATEPGRYTQADLALLRDVAERCALALDNARLYAAEQAARRSLEQANADLRASRDQLATVLRGVSDAVTAQAPDGRLVFANEAAARLLGYTSPADLLAEAPGTPITHWDMLDEQGRPFPWERLPGRRAARGEDAPEAVIRYRRRGGSEDRWSLVRAHPVRDATGQVVLSISLTQDITAQKRAEERMRFLSDAGARLPASLDLEQTLAAVAEITVETLADWCAVYLIAPDGRTITHSLVRHHDPFRVQQAMDFLRRYPPERDERSLMWQVIQAGRPLLLPTVPDTLLAQAARDPEHLAQIRAVGLTSALWLPLAARGRTLGVLGLFTAESQRRLGTEDQALAEEIAARASLAIDNAALFAAERAARAQAEDAVRLRDEFLSIASHELRNPVAGISGTAQLLRRTSQRGILTPEHLARSLDRLERTARHLATLTEDLLDVSRLRRGSLPLRPQPTDLAALVQDAVARAEGQAPGHTFHVTLARQPWLALLDPNRIDQIISNLLDNAVKYSPDGGTVDVRLEPAEDGALVSVADQGIGLPPGAEDSIFEPFGRAPNAAARNVPGLGLGLYICRRLAEQHGGRLWAASPGEGQGTTFRLWLPEAPHA